MLTHSRALLIVLVLAAILRIWFLAGIPLVITNDGIGYLQWAQQILGGHGVDWPTFRTPGYSLFLALVFLIAGASPVAVLVAQLALGLGICGLVTHASGRLAGPRVAVVFGAAAAIDPWLMGFSFYALTEVLSAFLLVLAMTILLTARRSTLAAAIAVGLILACLVLVRPAFQVIVPFFIAACVFFAPRGWKIRTGTATAMALTFLVAVSPWLWHNQQRGITGLSGGSTLFLWIGAAGAGLLDDEYPLPEDLRVSYEAHVRPAPTQDGKYTFLAEANAWDDRERRRILTTWASHSLRKDPQAWGETFLFALGWQLGYFPRQGPIVHSHALWMLRRLSQDGRDMGAAAGNYQFTPGPEMSQFAMQGRSGPQRFYFAGVARYRDIGMLHILFLAAASAAAVAAAIRRRWHVTAIFVATILYYALHAAFLLPYDRFSFPCWMAWYIAPAALVAQARSRRRLDAHAPEPAPAL